MSSDIVADIKDRLSCAEYVGRDVPLKRQGQNLVGVCPFHGERTGSLTIFPKTDSWYCFGCSAGGDLFTYYQCVHNCDFREALQALAREAGVQLAESPEQREQVRKLRERGEVLAAVAKFYHEKLGPSQREYLRGRGFRDEFVDSYLFGYAPGSCIRAALASVPPATLQELGLVRESGADFFARRIIIPIYGRDGSSIVNLVGRHEDLDGLPKYLRLPGEDQLINERALKGAKTLFLAEGDTDTPTLIQAGLPVVGVPGVSALKEEWLEKFKHVETIYVCADADPAGESLVRRAGGFFGSRARVVELPAGEDVNSYVAKGGDVEALAREAKPYIEWLMARLPIELPPGDADRILEPVLAALGKVGKASQDLYSKQLAKRFGITTVSVREALREGQSRNGEDKDSALKLTDSRIVWRMPRLVNPAQDLVNGTMLTTVFLDIIGQDPETKAEKVVTTPYVVTSKREVFPLSEVEMWRRGWRYADTKKPALTIAGRRWSTEETAIHSVKAYLDSKVTVNPWDVYQEVVAYFRTYLDYPNDCYYDLLALWTIGTYFFNLYQCYPYVHLTGSKRTGKSRTLNVIAELAFNSLWSASMTSAAAYRSVESCSSTLLFDEAENLQERKPQDNDKAQENPQNDKMEILKAGYQKGQMALRCSGDNNEPTGYDIYSPKVFGGTQSLDRVLGDRTIPLILARRTRELPEFLLSELKTRFRETRDKLYVLMLDFAINVYEEIKAGIGWGGVQDRERELWTPILTLAQFIDAARLGDEPDVKPEDLLTSRMRQLAVQKGEEKLAREQAEQPEVLVLEATLEYLADPEIKPIKGANFYLSSALFRYVKKHEGLYYLIDARALTRELEKTTVIRSKEDLIRVTVNGKQSRAVRLDLARIQEIAHRYGVNVP